MRTGYSPVEGAGLQRTDIECHECSKSFIAQLDFSISGNHVIECPHCGHEHCRVITDGKITGARWSTRHQRVDVEARRVWKSDAIQGQTSTAAMFIRDLWLNRSDP